MPASSIIPELTRQSLCQAMRIWLLEHQLSHILQTSGFQTEATIVVPQPGYFGVGVRLARESVRS